MDVKRYRYQDKTSPPNTTRRCHVCNKKTTWIFNPSIGHSQCEECGYRKISDTLINYEGRIMKKENKTKDVKDNREHIMKNTYTQSYISKLLNKKIRCTLLNLDIVEGILTGINQYEIAMLIEGEEVIIFKHGIFAIKEYKENLD